MDAAIVRKVHNWLVSNSETCYERARIVNLTSTGNRLNQYNAHYSKTDQTI